MSNRARVAILVVLFSIPSPGAASADPEGPRDPATAGLLSGGITFGGALVVAMAIDRDSPGLGALGGTALALGPSTGHWYAGDAFNPGLGVRVAGLALGALGAALHESMEGGGDCATGRCRTGRVLLVASPILVVTGTIYEILTAPRAARDYNRRHSMGVTPTVTADGFGLAIAGRF